MRHLYESDKYDVLTRIRALNISISQRLLPTFSSLESEAKEIEQNKFQELSAKFDPEFSDEADIYESAYHEGVEHYLIQVDIKKQFLKSCAMWVFHLFENDCSYVFDELKGNDRREKLVSLGVDVSGTSNWHKCNNELRVVANAIKHGAGDSMNKLKSQRPDLIVQSQSQLSIDYIEINLSDISVYIEAMEAFWEEFYCAVLSKR